MTPHDRGTFAGEIAKLFAGRQAAAPTQIELETYFETLEEFPLSVVVAACREARRQRGTFRPSDGDVWHLCVGVSRRLSAEKDAARERKLLAQTVRPWTEAECLEARRLLLEMRHQPSADSTRQREETNATLPPGLAVSAAETIISLLARGNSELLASLPKPARDVCNSRGAFQRREASTR
jgi:hypothetical protein